MSRDLEICKINISCDGNVWMTHLLNGEIVGCITYFFTKDHTTI